MADQPSSILLFVYGTLRPGERAYSVQLGPGTGAEVVGPARTRPSYTLVNLGHYPAMVECGDTAVVGEVVRVPISRLGALDDYEGPQYERRPVALDDGRIVQAYVADPEAVAGNRFIASGDWKQR